MFKYLIVLIAIPFARAQEVDMRHQLLWEISGNGLDSPSYIYGSFHHNDRRLFNFSDSVYYAMNQSDGVVLETDVFSLFEEWDTRISGVKLRFDSEGKPYTWSSESTETLYGNEDGMPQFLDAYFQQYCSNSGKNFYALETTDSQLDLFSNIDFNDPSPSRLESILVTQEDIMETYIKGDIYRVDELTRLNLSLTDGLYESLILDRNHRMSFRLDSLLKSSEQQLFCAVGAGHLAGNEGMLNLLRKHGYTIRHVIASYREGIDMHRLEVKRNNYFTYSNDSVHFSAQFPGKPMEILEEGGDLRLIYRDFGQGNTYEVQVLPRNDESSLKDLADVYIASPAESPLYKIQLSNGGDAFEGISDAYPEGYYWTRILMGPQDVLILKAYGGNKFMNSNRAERFFNGVNFN